MPLSVYLAHDAPVAAVLRRGPTEWVRLSLWHTDTDVVKHGQWLHGRVYEMRSDLSWDGSLFVAFVWQNRPYPRDTWVALSRPPYFTALALWFVGSTWCAGGFFPRRRTLWTSWMGHPPDEGTVPAWLEHTSELPHPQPGANWTDETVHVNRLLRDGWRQESAREFHKTLPDGRILLRMEGGYQEPAEHALLEGDEFQTLDGATWADVDQGGRLVLVRRGFLCAWNDEDGVVELADLNGGDPDPQKAPTWATRWPAPPP